MKYAFMLLSAGLLATFAACQSSPESAGPPRNYSDLNQYQKNAAPPSSPERPGVEHGDVYKEEFLGRYDINQDQ
jgi:hypothetical protein